MRKREEVEKIFEGQVDSVSPVEEKTSEVAAVAISHNEVNNQCPHLSTSAPWSSPVPVPPLVIPRWALAIALVLTFFARSA